MDKIKLLQFHKTFLSEKKSIKKISFLDSSKCFSYDSALELKKQEIDSTFIDLDVSCSGFQIMGLLCGDLKTLKLTNFLKSSKKKCDFYNDFIFQFSNFINFFLKTSKFSFIEKRIIFKIIEFSFTRNLLKKVIISFLYGQEIRTRAVCFFKNFNSFKKVIEELQIDFNFYCTNLKKQRNFFSIVFKICITLSKLFNNFFETKYFNFFSLKKLIQKLALSKKVQREGLSLNLGKTRSFVNYKCFKTCYFRKKILNKRIRVLKQSDVFDKNSAKKRAMPNFIHRIDAELCAIVCEKLGVNNLSVVTSHDCFNIFLNNKEEVKIYYFNACVSLILNSKIDILFEFIKANSDISFLEEHQDLIKFFKKKRFLILKKIKKKKLFMSSFILS